MNWSFPETRNPSFKFSVGNSCFSRSELPVIKPNSQSVLQNFSLSALLSGVVIYLSHASKECDYAVHDIHHKF